MPFEDEHLSSSQHDLSGKTYYGELDNAYKFEKNIGIFPIGLLSVLAWLLSFENEILETVKSAIYIYICAEVNFCIN